MEAKTTSNLQRPDDMLAHHVAGMVKPSLQGRPQISAQHLVRTAPQGIAQCHRHIAQPALMTDAPDWAAFGETQKFFFTPVEQGHQLLAAQARPFIEVGQGAAPGELVPGADELAVVAAIDAVAHQRAQLLGNGTRVLDGQVRDAAPCVQPVRRDDGLGGADELAVERGV